MDLAISISTGTRLCANNKQECKQTKSTPLVAQKQDFQQHYKLKTSVGAVVGFLPGIFYICWLFLLKGLEPSVQLIALLLQCHKQWRIRFYSRNARDGQNVTAHHWFAEKKWFCPCGSDSAVSDQHRQKFPSRDGNVRPLVILRTT